MGSCSVSVTPKGFFVLTVHKTKDGLGVISDPLFKCGLDTSSTEVGDLVIVSLRSSRTDFDRSSEPPDRVLPFVGYKSWGAFERAAIRIQVRNDGERVTVTPTDPAPRGGFLFDPDSAVECGLQAEEIGKVLFGIVEEKKK